MILFPTDILPALGTRYRNTTTGKLATLRNYVIAPGHNLVRLLDDDGHEWVGSSESFWETWINEKIRI